MRRLSYLFHFFLVLTLTWCVGPSVAPGQEENEVTKLSDATLVKRIRETGDVYAVLELERRYLRIDSPGFEWQQAFREKLYAQIPEAYREKSLKELARLAKSDNPDIAEQSMLEIQRAAEGLRNDITSLSAERTLFDLVGLPTEGGFLPETLPPGLIEKPVSIFARLPVESGNEAITTSVTTFSQVKGQQLTELLYSTDAAAFDAAYAELGLMQASLVAGEREVGRDELWKFKTQSEAWLKSQTTVAEDILTVKLKPQQPLKDMAYLRLADEVRGLELDAAGHTDESLAYVAGRETLLYLAVEHLTPKLCSYAKLSFPNLVDLHIKQSQISTTAVCKLDMPNLQLLNLSDTPLGDDFLKDLQHTKIRYLNLCGTTITPPAMKHLDRFTELRTVDIDFESFSPELPEVLAKIKTFLWLDVHCHPADQEKLKAIQYKFRGKCNILMRVREIKDDGI